MYDLTGSRILLWRKMWERDQLVHIGVLKSMVNVYNSNVYTLLLRFNMDINCKRSLRSEMDLQITHRA